MNLKESKQILIEYEGSLPDNNLPAKIMNAKWIVYNEEISKKYPEKDYPHLVPDFNEGWK